METGNIFAFGAWTGFGMRQRLTSQHKSMLLYFAFENKQSRHPDPIHARKAVCLEFLGLMGSVLHRCVEPKMSSTR